MNLCLLISLAGLLACLSDATYLQYKGERADNKIHKEVKFAGCHEMWEAGETEPGVYTVYPNATHPVKVYCNHSAEVTFIVIQRRYYGNENFNRGWNDYKHGFGNLAGDFWLGLDAISQLTSTGAFNLQIEMQDWSNQHQVVHLLGFKVYPESHCYQMTFRSYSGSLPNDFASMNGMCFWTFDKPDPASCAIHQKCGWWFNGNMQCTYALLNGMYYTGGHYQPKQYYDGIYYKDWHDYNYSLKFVAMSLYK